MTKPNSQDQPVPTSGGNRKKDIAVALWSVAKWAVIGVALYYLWREGVLSRERFRFTGQVVWALPGAVTLLLVSTAAAAFRCHCLLRCLVAPSSLGGQFAIFFPGLLVQQVGSDAAFDVMRLIGLRRMGGGGSVVVAALMVDRLLGLLALSAIAVTGLAIFWEGTEWLPLAAGAVAVLGAVPLAFACFHSLVAANPASWMGSLPGAGFLASVGESVKVFRFHVPVLLGLFFLSVAVHLAMFGALYFCGLALAGVVVGPLEALLGGAIAIFTGVLPLPMAGLGVGEIAFGSVVAKLRGMGEAGDFAGVFLVNRLLLLSLGLVFWAALALAKKRDGS